MPLRSSSLLPLLFCLPLACSGGETTPTDDTSDGTSDSGGSGSDSEDANSASGGSADSTSAGGSQTHTSTESGGSESGGSGSGGSPMGSGGEGSGGTSAPPDTDGDGVPDETDNCPGEHNPEQTNSDTDSLGDACDNCPTADNENQANSDTDSRGDACDNCVATDNEDQKDLDEDGVGDACDNCRCTSNADQGDANENTVGDVCEPCPEGSFRNPTTLTCETCGAGEPEFDVCFAEEGAPLQIDWETRELIFKTDYEFEPATVWVNAQAGGPHMEMDAEICGSMVVADMENFDLTGAQVEIEIESTCGDVYIYDSVTSAFIDAQREAIVQNYSCGCMEGEHDLGLGCEECSMDIDGWINTCPLGTGAPSYDSETGILSLTFQDGVQLNYGGATLQVQDCPGGSCSEPVESMIAGELVGQTFAFNIGIPTGDEVITLTELVSGNACTMHLPEERASHRFRVRVGDGGTIETENAFACTCAQGYELTGPGTCEECDNEKPAPTCPFPDTGSFTYDFDTNEFHLDVSGARGILGGKVWFTRSQYVSLLGESRTVEYESTNFVIDGDTIIIDAQVPSEPLITQEWVRIDRLYLEENCLANFDLTIPAGEMLANLLNKTISDTYGCGD